MAESKFFEVVKGQLVSSEHYGRNFAEGEVIDLSYRTDEEIAAILESGTVKPTKRTMTKTINKEITEVKNDGSN